MSDLTSPPQPATRIRNQRYRRWVEIAGLMLMLLFVATLVLPLFLGRSLDRIAKPCLVACFLALAAYCLRGFLLVLDLQERPLPSRRETARAVFDRVVRGVRRADLARVAGVSVALTLFGWVVPRRMSVPFLLLGDVVAFDSRVPVPAAAVQQVRFAPDPDEDYAELEQPVRFCEAAVELRSGKEFRLTLDEADAGRLREWADGRGIPVRNREGYNPRTAEPTAEAPAHERSHGTA